ncbi:MAG: acetate--CoA ligase family protein [Candidatus Bathyarchaeota archaeon]|nr:acetate--CoA ligase family protein [Candidatus Bathyarchaeota archaeon]
MRDPKIDKIFQVAKAEKRNFLFEHEAKMLCGLYGVPITRIEVAKTEDAAVEAAKRIGFPIVLKIVSAQVLHKSDAGGVIVGVNDEKGIREGYQRIVANIKKNVPTAVIDGILVQEMAPKGTEIIIGSTVDPTFGPTIMFGLGGIFVEILKDVSFRLAPITKEDAWEMLDEIKAKKMLEGPRGTPKADKEAIVATLLAVSKMLMECPEIKELDMNPLLVYEKGARAVDARVIL